MESGPIVFTCTGHSRERTVPCNILVLLMVGLLFGFGDLSLLKDRKTQRHARPEGRTRRVVQMGIVAGVTR